MGARSITCLFVWHQNYPIFWAVDTSLHLFHYCFVSSLPFVSLFMLFIVSFVLFRHSSSLHSFVPLITGFTGRRLRPGPGDSYEDLPPFLPRSPPPVPYVRPAATVSVPSRCRIVSLFISISLSGPVGSCGDLTSLEHPSCAACRADAPCNSFGITKSDPIIIIVLGCSFKIRLIFFNFREIERSVKKRLKSFNKNRAGVSEFIRSTSSKACKGFLLAKPSLFGLFV